MQFCDLIRKMINDDLLFLDNIVFSDEATFELTRNRHNYRYWSDQPSLDKRKSYPALTKS